MSYKPLLPKYKVIIFDEAHKLYDVAKQMYGCYLSEAEFAELVSYTKSCKAEILNGLCDLLDISRTKLFKKIQNADDENTSEHKEANIDVYAI